MSVTARQVGDVSQLTQIWWSKTVRHGMLILRGRENIWLAIDIPKRTWREVVQKKIAKHVI